MSYDQWKTACPPEYDDGDELKTEMEMILEDPEVMADVIYAADLDQLQDLAGVLCDLVTSNKVNWDLQHANSIRQAVNEFVKSAATEAVNYEERLNGK